MAKKSKRIPEKTVADKATYYKTENRALKNRIENLEKRIVLLEKQLEVYKNIKPEDVIQKKETIKQTKETQKESFRKQFLKDHYPKGKKE